MTVTMKQLLIVIMVVMLAVVIATVRNNICFLQVEAIFLGSRNRYTSVPYSVWYSIRSISQIWCEKGHFYSRVSNRLILAANGSSTILYRPLYCAQSWAQLLPQTEDSLSPKKKRENQTWRGSVLLFPLLRG